MNYVELLNNFELLQLQKIKEIFPQALNDSKLDNQYLIDFLLDLTNKEIRFRDNRAKEINVSISHFPTKKTIKDFDFDFQPSLDKNKIKDLLTLRFIENNENIVFLGLPGTGKTLLSCCIGHEAASNRISTYFIHCNELLNQLKKAKFENKLDYKIKLFCKYKLLIIDEFGFLPLNKDDANLLFQLVSARYESKSTIITTNIPFSKWGESLNDPVIATAILDRLIHHCHIIQIDGPSYRTKDVLIDK